MPNFGHFTNGAEVVDHFKDRVKGKTILITGPDEACVGTETALALAAGSPACIIFADYSWHNVQTVIYRISATQPDVVTLFITLDLSSQNAIRNAAATINQSVHSIDILINNAGIMACPFARNVDWIESQFGYYIGHFLLTNLIMERLIAGQGARIVNVSNSGHRMSDVRLYNWNFQHGFEYNAWSAYGSTKTANILFTVALTSKLHKRQVDSISLDPGPISTNNGIYFAPEAWVESLNAIVTNIGRPFSSRPPKTIQQGCSTALVAALDPDLPPGCYLEDCVVAEPEAYAKDQHRADRLWALGEKIVGEFNW